MDFRPLARRARLAADHRALSRAWSPALATVLRLVVVAQYWAQHTPLVMAQAPQLVPASGRGAGWRKRRILGNGRSYADKRRIGALILRRGSSRCRRSRQNCHKSWRWYRRNCCHPRRSNHLSRSNHLCRSSRLLSVDPPMPVEPALPSSHPASPSHRSVTLASEVAPPASATAATLAGPPEVPAAASCPAPSMARAACSLPRGKTGAKQSARRPG